MRYPMEKLQHRSYHRINQIIQQTSKTTQHYQDSNSNWDIHIGFKASKEGG